MLCTFNVLEPYQLKLNKFGGGKGTLETSVVVILWYLL